MRRHRASDEWQDHIESDDPAAYSYQGSGDNIAREVNAAGDSAPREKRACSSGKYPGYRPHPEHRNGDNKNRKNMTARE